MALVAFAILFSGVINGYFAAGPRRDADLHLRRDDSGALLGGAGAAGGMGVCGRGRDRRATAVAVVPGYDAAGLPAHRGAQGDRLDRRICERPVSKETLSRIRRDLRRVSRPALRHPDTESFENHMRVVERSGCSYTEALEGTTNIRIYGTPSQAILEMLSQAAGSGVPMTVLPEHLGGFIR
jgi:hypothetical protein